jgi:hypothetical protein
VDLSQPSAHGSGFINSAFAIEQPVFRVYAFLNPSNGTGDFAGAQTARTNMNAAGRTFNQSLNTFYIGLESAVGTPV